MAQETPIAQEEDLDALLQRINDEREDGDAGDAGVQQFKITSDIGRDDYRAFVYYSVLMKSPWILPVYLIAPILVALSFSYKDGRADIPLTLGILAVLYVIIATVVVLRTERSLSKTNKKNPDLMRLTPTTFTFLSGAIINSKKSGDVRVPYKKLQKLCETQKRFILYFEGKKAMVIRKEDVERDAGTEKFRSFIRSKINQ